MTQPSIARSSRPKLLILAFSELARDPRVKRQLLTLRDTHDITVLGRGDPNVDGVRVISLPRTDSTAGLTRKVRYVLRQAAFRGHWYSLSYWLLPHIRWAWEKLSQENWDLVLANDADPVPLANRLNPSLGVIVDLHEFAPRQYDNRPQWMRSVAPYYEWLVKRHVTQAAATVTVSNGIAAAYREYGLEPAVVRSAAMFSELPPGAVGDPIRLVHSGGAARSRLLESMIEATNRTSSNVTLDLYLVADNDRTYVEELVALAGVSDRVQVNDAVSFEQLVPTLNQFDVGLCMIPPTTFNHLWCLPNKFFDFLQARLGIITGPSPEIATIVEQEGFGALTSDFSVEALTDVLDQLDQTTVETWKQMTDAAAKRYSGEQELVRLLKVLEGVRHGRLSD